MTSTHGKRHEGIYRDEAGTVDSEGFITPSVGLVEHALYFTSLPDVVAKTKQVIDQGRLELPGAVVVWDETIGRRTGAKAIPDAWWAGSGSLTLSFVFPGVATDAAPAIFRDVVSATSDALGSFSPSSPISHDDSGIFMLDGKRVGMIRHEAYNGTELFILRVNGCTDYSKAPKSVQDGNSRLIDYIDSKNLPLGNPRTLPNTLALKLMETIPGKLRGRFA